ncbi:uncharacterized protein V2V93DRAFT_362730 [Kockiozyma suomiensis]|uniref:uncharacterized protein n=1 Tax=Kockiozyma suomiensis TaxID=1337062 RepID=UPI0033430B5A
MEKPERKPDGGGALAHASFFFCFFFLVCAFLYLAITRLSPRTVSFIFFFPFQLSRLLENMLFSILYYKILCRNITLNFPDIL